MYSEIIKHDKQPKTPMKTRRPTTQRQRRKRRAADESTTLTIEREKTPTQSLETLRNPQASTTERGRAALGLQRTLGNAGMGRVLAQREDISDDSSAASPPVSAVSSFQLRSHLLNLQGVTSTNLLTLRIPPAAKKLPKWLDPDNPEPLKKFWSLKFELEIDPQSALGQAIEQQETFEFLIHAGAESGDTPLGLELFNTAINMLPATKPGEVIKQLLKLNMFTLYFNPSKRTFGAGVTLEF